MLTHRFIRRVSILYSLTFAHKDTTHSTHFAKCRGEIEIGLDERASRASATETNYLMRIKERDIVDEEFIVGFAFPHGVPVVFRIPAWQIERRIPLGRKRQGRYNGLVNRARTFNDGRCDWQLERWIIGIGLWRLGITLEFRLLQIARCSRVLDVASTCHEWPSYDISRIDRFRWIVVGSTFRRYVSAVRR